MNAKINDLIRQSYVTVRSQNDRDVTYFSQEKFAELIVRECMEQVWYTREDSINGNVSLVIKQRIEQHFGVEE